MTRRFTGCTLAGLILGFVWLSNVSTPLSAGPLTHVPLVGQKTPHETPCEPGYKYVEEIVYKDVIKKVCRDVVKMEKKTRWIYDYKCVDYCEKKCSLHGFFQHKGCNECQSCAECVKVRTKRVLMKLKIVDEVPVTKCVVEHVVERVPCVVRHKVPCGEVPGGVGVGSVVVPNASEPASKPVEQQPMAEPLPFPQPAPTDSNISTQATSPRTDPPLLPLPSSIFPALPPQGR